MKKISFEDRCKAAFEDWKANSDEDEKYSAAGYAKNPRALLGFVWDEAEFGTMIREVWPDDFSDRNGADVTTVATRVSKFGVVAQGWMCDLFTVQGTSVEPSTGQHVIVVNSIDHTGKVHSLRIPRGVIVGNDNAFASYCADRGFNIAQNKALRRGVQSLLSVLQGPSITLTERTGWIGKSDTFMLPSGKVLGDKSNRALFTAEKAEAANMVVKAGTYDAWDDLITRTVPGNSRLELALCAGLYSPLMRYSDNAKCVVFNIYGESSLGKSTSGSVFGSVWGGSKTRALGYAHSWHTTYNSLMALAGSYSGIGLSLDEIQHCPSPDVAYAFYEGEEKSRLTSDTKQRKKRQWECIAWSTGEKRLEDLVSENVKTRDAGVQSGREARFFDIPVTATGAIKGVVENLHDFSNPSALVGAISQGTREHFGHAGPAFVEHIFEFTLEHGDDALRDKVRAASRKVYAALDLAKDAHPVVERVARGFAEVGAAGIIAAEFGVIPNDAEDLINGVVKCFQDWLAVRGSAQHTQADIKPIVALRDFISSKKHLFQNPDRPDDFRGAEIVGYVKEVRGQHCYCLTNKSWDMVQKIGRRSNLAQSLDDRGLLVKQADGKFKVQIRFGKDERERFYAVSSRILHVDDSGQLTNDNDKNDADEAHDDLSGDANYGRVQVTVSRALKTIKGGKR